MPMVSFELPPSRLTGSDRRENAPETSSRLTELRCASANRSVCTWANSAAPLVASLMRDCSSAIESAMSINCFDTASPAPTVTTPASALRMVSMRSATADEAFSSASMRPVTRLTPSLALSCAVSTIFTSFAISVPVAQFAQLVQQGFQIGKADQLCHNRQGRPIDLPAHQIPCPHHWPDVGRARGRLEGQLQRFEPVRQFFFAAARFCWCSA